MFMFIIFTQNAKVKTEILNAFFKTFFKSDDVGFFDFKLEKSFDHENVIQIDRDVYYRDVFMFVKKIKDAVMMYEAETIRSNFSVCLKSIAQI